MKKLLILFFALPLLTNAQIVSVQDSSGYLFSVNPLTGAKVQLTIPQTGQSGKVLSTDGVRFSWLTPLSNPMTTGGDLIYGGASGTPTRLPNGTANFVLQSNGTTLAPSWVALAGGGNALTSNPLSQFASTTSAQFMGVISDETGGAGVVVGSASPAFTGTPTVGTLGYAASNPLLTLQSSVNAFNQLIIQNSSNGVAASSDIIVNNDQSTNTTFYGDFGMNSSGYTGSPLSNVPNTVYLMSTSAPLLIGTTTAHAINFVTNDSTGSAMTIGSDGVVTIPNLTDGTTFIATAGGTTTLTKQSTRYQIFTGSLTQIVVLPDARTLTLGKKYYIDNNSTGAVTINTNGGATLYTLAGNHDVFFVLGDNSTAAGVWDTNVFGNLDIANTWSATQTLATGTTAIAPLNIPVGVMKTTPATGDITRGADGIFTACVAASENGVVPSTQYSVVASDFTLSAASGVQSAFPTTGDVWTVAANTLYEVEGNYIMTTGTTTTKTTAIAFALTTATVNYVSLNVQGWNAVPNTVATAQGTVQMTQVGSVVITATATTAGVGIYFKGTISFGTGGQITPQINFSANPGGTNLMKAGSYIKFTKLGANTFSTIGNVN